MALNSLGLGFVFTAKDLASGTIQRVGGAFGAMDRNALRSAQSYQRNFAVMGAGMALMGAGAATLAGAFTLAGMAEHFELELARVGAVASATSEDMVLLRQAAIDAGIATQFNPTQAMEGLGALAQQGFNTENSIRLLTPALDLAAGGMISVEAAAQSVTAAVHVFGLSMDEATGVADQLLTITNSTALAAGDMELAIGTVARGARLTHQSISEMLPAIGLLRNTGVDVSVASQSVSSALTFMASRADLIRQKLGVNLVETLADGTQQFRPFMDIAMEAGTALEERFANPAQRTAMAVKLFSRFGVGAVTGVFESLRNGVTDSTGRLYRGAEAVDFLRKQMTHADGAAANFRERLLDTFAGQQTLLKGSLETLGVIVGEGFTRGLRPFVEGSIGLVNRIIRVFNEIPLEVRGAMASATIAFGGLLFVFGAIIASGAAIAIIAPFIKAIAVAVAGLLIAMAPFIALAGIIFGIGYAFQRLIAINERFSSYLARGAERVRLAFRGLVQLFTTGEISGAIARDLSKAENGGILDFIGTVYALGFRVVQFFRGVGAGFEAGLATLGPSVDRMIDAFTQLGEALGFVGAEGAEAVAGMPSSEFATRGAQIGSFLAGVVEVMVDMLAITARFVTGAVAGWNSFFDTIAPGLALLGPSLEFAGEQINDLLVRVGMISGEGAKGTSGIKAFGQAVGFFLASAVDFAVFALNGLIATVGAVAWAINGLIRFFSAGGLLDRGMRGTAVVVSNFFLNLLNGFRMLVDEMISGIGSLVSMVPPSLRPEGLESLITSGADAQTRIVERTAVMKRRRVSGGDAFAATPGAAMAGAYAEAQTRDAGGLAAVQTLIAAQAKERNAETWGVEINLDGEVLARGVARGKSRDDATSFGATPAVED